MTFRFLLLVLGLVSVAIAGAKPLEQPLGLNLAYLRVHSLPGDFPGASPAPLGSVVLDLRFTTADEGAAAALVTWLRAQASPAHPVIVLVNADTAPALLAPLAQKTILPGVVSIGLESSQLKPDIVLPVTPKADRAAYDALEEGTKLDVLIARKLDKVRRDEASVARDRTPATLLEPEPIEEPPATAGTEVKSGKATPTPTPPPQPIDAVLQRAVQLHRALLALRKI